MAQRGTKTDALVRPVPALSVFAALKERKRRNVSGLDLGLSSLGERMRAKRYASNVLMLSGDRLTFTGLELFLYPAKVFQNMRAFAMLVLLGASRMNF